jgi:hypothetical protein
VDVSDDYGVVVDHTTIAEIKEAVQKISGLPAKELELMARKAWEFARENHTREHFAEEYRRIVSEIIAPRAHPQPAAGLNSGGSDQNGSPYTNAGQQPVAM